jgi:RNA polymerase sigma-70 factor (ECF subfamily)
MADDAKQSTSATLIERLRNPMRDEAAWREFVHSYGPKLFQWCRQWGLQQADAEDVTQNILLKLADKLRTFTYDPSGSFRGWLRTVAHHAWRDFLDGRLRAPLGTGDSAVLQRLEKIEAREDLLAHLAAEFDQELLEEAMARVKRRVAPHTWEAFQLTAVEGLSGAEAAQRVPLQVAMVFVAKSKVQKMLRQEIQRLEGASVNGGASS